MAKRIGGLALTKAERAQKAAAKRAKKSDKHWKDLPNWTVETKEFLDDIRCKAGDFQRRRTYDISKFVLEQYEHLLLLKERRCLKKTLRVINEALRIPARTNRLFGFVERASIPEWDVRRISFVAGLLDDALSEGIELKGIEGFRKEYARKPRGRRS